MAKTLTTGFITNTINGIKIDTSKHCNSGNYADYSSRSVSYVTIHYTGNPSDTAWANANYFQTAGNRNASAHFFVDDSNIYQSVALRNAAWHCGASTYYNGCRNSNSIGIEMCTSGNYKVSAKTQENAAYLCAHICKLLGISANQVDTYVVRHWDVTHKKCPAQFVDNSSEWTDFKAKVKKILGGTTISQSSTTTTTKPTSSSSTKTTSSGSSSIKEVQKWCNSTYKTGLEVDGVYGAKTKAALVKGLQTELNKQYGAKLVVDGIFGNKTSSAIRNIQNGAQGNYAKVLQGLLICNGYSTGGFDGDFGGVTESAVKSYQKKKGLTVDGVAGKNTFTKLCA